MTRSEFREQQLLRMIVALEGALRNADLGLEIEALCDEARTVVMRSTGLKTNQGLLT